MQARSVRHTSELRACALPPSFPHPPPSFLRLPPSFLRRQESRRTRCVREPRRSWTASRRSAPPSVIPPPLRHSCAGRNPGEPARFENGADARRPPAGPRPPSVIPAPPSVIPAPPSVIPAPPSFLRPLRHSCAGRNPGEPGAFENGADAGRPPAGPSAPSGGLVARRRDGGVGRTWVVAWIPACAGMTEEGERNDGGRRTG